MQKKLNIVVVILLIGAIGLMSTRLFITLFPKAAERENTSEGISYIQALENINVTKAEKSTVKEETTKKKEEPKKKKAPARKKPEHTTTTEPPEIVDGNFKAAFKDIVISGDSIVMAIYEYGVLDDTQVIAKIGAGAGFLKDSTPTIVNAQPQFLILHYGENELSTKEEASYFINRYKECIQNLQKQLPNTVIFVDSIFPVLEKAYRSEPYTVNIDYYNSLLNKMCSELNVIYLDYTQTWHSYEKNYYDADGIHPLKSYYTEQYLPYIFAEVNKKR